MKDVPYFLDCPGKREKILNLIYNNLKSSVNFNNRACLELKVASNTRSYVTTVGLTEINVMIVYSI